MAYDVRFDAPGALALGGVGALGGLAYSYLNKKQRKNKLRNALIGAAALPATWIGGKYIAGKILDATNGPNSSYVLHYDPLGYINEPAISAVGATFHPDKVSKLDALQKRIDKALEQNNITDCNSAVQEYNNTLDYVLNTTAALGYGTLGAGIGLPALYLAYLKKKKKPLQEQLV